MAQKVFHGSVNIKNERDLNRVRGKSYITGNLTVSPYDMDGASLPFLEKVGGDFSVEQSSLRRFSAPILSHVAGNVSIEGNSKLTDVDILSLSYIGKDLIINGNENLDHFLIPKLESVFRLYICDNKNLGSFGLPSLSIVKNELHIEHNTKLSETEAFKLRDRINNSSDVKPDVRIQENKKENLEKLSRNFRNALIKTATIGMKNGFVEVRIVFDLGDSKQSSIVTASFLAEGYRDDNIVYLIKRILEIADVSDFSQLSGKAVRIDSVSGMATAIAHIIKDSGIVFTDSIEEI